MTNLAATFLLALVWRAKRGGVIVGEHTLSQAETSFHIQVLSRWFEFIHLEDLPRRVLRPKQKPFCLLTFDDGKRSNYTETAPVLERLGVPAVFYVTTDFLTNGTCLWFDLRNQLINELGYCPRGMEIATLKQLPFDALMERLSRACTEHGFMPNLESDYVHPMSWTEVRSLNERGFTIGAHGSTHAILTRETRKRAFSEIEDSLEKVSAELGRPCKTFAFPNGNYDTELTQYAQRCGASTLMTTDPMWADTSSLMWRLPRIQLFGSFSQARIELKIALAAIQGVLRNPNGSGRQYRYMRRADRAISQLTLN